MCTVYIDCGCLSRNIRSNELFVSLYLTLDRSMWYLCLNSETEQSDDLIEIFLLAAATAWLFDCLFVFLFCFVYYLRQEGYVFSRVCLSVC